ncbi:MAG: hypothetical protein ACR2PS_16395 [Pseudomonadales bacterium]
MSNTSIPLNSIKKSFLMKVPASSYSRVIRKVRQPSVGRIAKLLRPTQKTASTHKIYQNVSNLKLNIAGWMLLPIEIRKPVSLILVYRDQLGEHGLLVDEMKARGASEVLMSGVVEIRATGAIQNIELYCGGVSHPRVGMHHAEVQVVKNEDDFIANHIGTIAS